MQIRPMSDWVCLKRHDYKHRTLYVHGAKTHRGTVVAVGPGKRLKKWVEVTSPVTGKSFRVRAGDETGYRKPMDLRPGDVVEYSDAGWEERIINNQKYIFTRQDSVICFADLLDTEGLQGHSSPILP
jgi:co-chaperonin GroES (HSP10)